MLLESSLNLEDMVELMHIRTLLSNLEALNAEMIKGQVIKEERFYRLREIAKHQLSVLNDKDFLKTLKKINESVYVENKKKIYVKKT
jgi:hypothetical protein